MSLTILGTGSALPRTVVTNEDIAGVIDTSDRVDSEPYRH